MASSPLASLIDKHVGNRVRVRRLSLGISQQELAGQLGLTFQQIQKYEKGANRIGASRLYELAGLLRVNVDFFFEGLNRDEINSGHDQEMVIEAFRESSPRFGAREFVDLNQAFQSISKPELRDLLLSLFNAIAEHEAEGGKASDVPVPDIAFAHQERATSSGS